jgi:hypothetical protein
MGGSPPSAPTTVMPAPTAPTLYQSVTPLQSYKQAAEQLGRIQKATDEVQGQRYLEVGTPADVGARQAGRRALEAAAYLSAVPSGDQYMAQTTGKTGQFAPLQQAAQENLTEAQKEYAAALKKIGEKPPSTVTETPSWAQSTTY